MGRFPFIGLRHQGVPSVTPDPEEGDSRSVTGGAGPRRYLLLQHHQHSQAEEVRGTSLQALADASSLALVAFVGVSDAPMSRNADFN